LADSNKALQDVISIGIVASQAAHNAFVARIVQDEAKDEEERNAIIEGLRTLLGIQISTPGPTPASSRGSSRSSSPVPGNSPMRVRNVFTRTPIKPTLSTVMETSPDHRKMPAIEETSPDEERKTKEFFVNVSESLADPILSATDRLYKTTRFALFVGTNVLSTPKWKEMQSPDLEKILILSNSCRKEQIMGPRKIFDDKLGWSLQLAQVEDCTCVRMPTGVVLSVVHHVKDMPMVRPLSLRLPFDAPIKSIQACGKILLATDVHGTLYTVAYKGKGVFDKPLAIIGTSINIAGIAPGSIVGFASKDLNDNDVPATWQISPVDEKGVPIPSEVEKDGTLISLPKLRVAAKIASGSGGRTLVSGSADGNLGVWTLLAGGDEP
jgi:hypothetical protein